MRDIATVVPGALDWFILDLVEAGFETADGRAWTGPLDPALVDLTNATTMAFLFEDGWPYRHPHLFVEGLRPSVHLNGTALCLWRVGEESLAWLRLADLRERIAQWADRYRGRATLVDPILDPDRYFIPRSGKLLATVDLSQIHWGNGGSGETTAVTKDELLEIGGKGDLRVRWYGRDGMRHPPVNIGMVKDGLGAQQARNLDRELERVGRPGGMDVLLLIWDTPPGEPAILVLRMSRNGDEVAAEAVEVARTDDEVLRRRAGPDAPALRAKRVVVFGQGAIGSHVAVTLARMGIESITGVDGERLRPGDVVRHAGLMAWVGSAKVDAVKMSAHQVAPWTKYTDRINESIWDPTQLRALAAGADLVIDAVGEASFTDQLSRVMVGGDIPLLSIALYRGGSIARVRVHCPGGIPIHERTDANRFAPIPPGPLEEVPIWESGCASPVNNAPPTSVLSAAALAARLAVGVLTGRETTSFDAVDVYEPIEPPFRCGRSSAGGCLMTGQAYIVESVLHSLKAFAEESRPLETGGVLAGVLRDDEPWITAAVQIRDPFRTSTAYVIPRGSTPLAVDVAREGDARVGYIGDWHSHPVDLPASGTDRTTLRRNARRRSPKAVPTILIVVRGTGDGWEIDAMADDGQHAQPIEIVVTGDLAGVAE